MKNQTQKTSITLKLCESAIMIAFATILSLLKLADLPFGGSITAASMLPVLLVAYRHGTVWGILTASVHGILQFLLGMSVLSYVTGWASICAVIVFDYFLAFALVGLGGIFRKMKSQRTALVLGALLAGILRYACHFVSGVTVWRDISIPADAAVIYSLVYNATYMIPETLVLCCAAFYVAGVLNFRAPRLSPVYTKEKAALGWPAYVGGAVSLVALVYDVVAVFSHLQNAETGDFDIKGIAAVDWMSVAIVTAIGAILAAFCVLIPKITKNKS